MIPEVRCRALELGLVFVLCGRALATQDPGRTATIYVHGFDPNGMGQTGVFGDDVADPILDEVAALVDLPTSSDPNGLSRPNVVTTTRYYGDTPPVYYDAADLADLDAVTARWGGGVPRYALIVAKYARHVLERSGADQVNFLSASFGSLVVRWLVEKDLETLASEGRIARWLSVEGLLAGSWAASQDDLAGLAELLQVPAVDVEHMRYAWIEQNLHAPRHHADAPVYAGILLGQVGSTEDRLHGRALTGAMLARGQFQPNDGVQGLWDACFRDMAPASRFLGLPPTLGVFHDTHYRIRDNPAARAQAAIFLTQSRRVTVSLKRATVHNIHEPAWPLLNLRPAEVVFQSRVFSRAIERRWGIRGAISELTVEGAAPPIRRFDRDGHSLEFAQMLFDDLVLAEETELELELWAEEIDLDLRYGVAETLAEPYFEFLGGGVLRIAAVQPGSYTFQAADWSGELEVSVFDYPFRLPTDVAGDSTVSRLPRGFVLEVLPNPFTSRLLIRVRATADGSGSGAGAIAAAGEIASLRIYDAAGRLVRTLYGPLQAGFEWDGRDSRGKRLPAGVYYHRLLTSSSVFVGRSQLVR